MDTRYPVFFCLGCATFVAGLTVQPTSAAERILFTAVVALSWFVIGFRSKKAQGS